MSALAQEDGRAETADGLSVYWQRSMPRQPRALLLFVHGLGEHSGRYRFPVGYFAPRGYGCYALDCRGHGKSAGIRGHVDGFGQYLDDVRAVHALARERHPELPLFLVGHSQGGLVVLLYALRFPAGLHGVVANSPALDVHPSLRPSRGLAVLGRTLSVVLPTFRLASGLDPALVSRDPAVVRAYVADPLVTGKVSGRWFTSTLAAQSEVRAGAARLQVPALVMASGSDRLVDAEATRRWAAGAAREIVEFVWWDGLYHESFNEPEREQVFARMESWLESRMAAAPPPRGAGVA